MLDLLDVIAIAVLCALALSYVLACDRLKGSPS